MGASDCRQNPFSDREIWKRVSLLKEHEVLSRFARQILTTRSMLERYFGENGISLAKPASLSDNPISNFFAITTKYLL